MKIAYVVYDYEKNGGIERYVRALAGRYANEHDVHVITANPCLRDKEVTFHPITIPEYLPSFVKLVLFARKVEEELRKDRFDIIHSQGSDCLYHNVLTAHSCHKAWVEKAMSLGVWERFKKMVHPLHAIVVRNERRNYEYVKRGIAVSHEVKREIMRYYKVSEDQIEVVYPGVDVRKDDPGEREKTKCTIRRALDIADDAFVILFVANEFRRKGLTSIIDALPLIDDPRIQLLVVGQGNPSFYRMLAMKKGVQNRVLFTGQVENVQEYYYAADLFLLPTKHEAFGMVITEAMSAGLPIVVSRFAGAAELVSDPRCLLTDPLDVHEIAAKVQYFLVDRKAAEQVGRLMKRTVEQYTWEAMAEKTMTIYRKAAGR